MLHALFRHWLLLTLDRLLLIYHAFRYFFGFWWFLSNQFLKFYFNFYDKMDMKSSFYFNRFYLVNISLMFVSCVNIRKQKNWLRTTLSRTKPILPICELIIPRHQNNAQSSKSTPHTHTHTHTHTKIRVLIGLFSLFAHDHSTKIYGPFSSVLSFVHDYLTKNLGPYWFTSFICTRPFDQNQFLLFDLFFS